MKQDHQIEKGDTSSKIDVMLSPNSKSTQLLEELLQKMVSRKNITILVIVSIIALLLSVNLVIFMVVFYIVVYFTIKQTLERRKFLQKYASIRNLKYAETLKKESLTGRLFRTINTRYDDAFIFGDYNNFPTKLFYYSYSTGNGKNSETFHFTITEIKIGNTIFSYILLQKNTLKKHQSTNLFGDDKDIQVSLAIHDKTYTLYTLKRYEIEALQVCNSEFIELIKTSYLPLCVEFAKNHVYIYTQSHLATEKDLDELYRVTKAVIDNFGPFFLRMKDDYEVLHEVYNKNPPEKIEN